VQVDLSADHFALFGLEKAFELDGTALTRRYRELQQALHPDRFAASSQAERRWSVQAASRVNDAYTTLRSPLARAVYLLSLEGVDIDEETDTRMDPLFLMEQMELREALEGVLTASDPQRALEGIRDRIADTEQTIATRFASGFAGGDTVGARTEARQWQFLDKLRREADQAESRLDV